MRRTSSTPVSETYEGRGVFPGEAEPSRVSSGTRSLDGERRVSGGVREIEQVIEVGIRTAMSVRASSRSEPDVNI